MKAWRDESIGRWHSDLPDVFDEMCEKLKNDVLFSFARYGDGEANAIYGKNGQNCDGHQYFTDLGVALKESIIHRRPYCYMGLQPLTIASDRINQIEKDFPDIDWVDADCIHNASIDGRLNKLFDILKSKTVIVVGPKFLDRDDVWNTLGLSPDLHIKIPEKNCWNEYKQIREVLIDSISDFIWAATNPVVLLCASMMSEVLINDIAHFCRVIDMGSVLDPYFGVKSRKYHNKLKL